MATNNAINNSLPTPFNIGGTSVTSTGTQLNYVNALTAVPINKINVQRVTASGAGTYTPTSGMVYVIVRAQAGGGAGGGAATTGAAASAAGAGGGGGEYIEALFTAAQIGASKAYVVGAKGTPGTAGNNPGNNGADTTFNSTFIVAKAGTGGAGCPSLSLVTTNVQSIGGLGGSGGSVATGTLITRRNGEPGDFAGNFNNSAFAGGGGSAGCGAGGADWNISGAGTDAIANSGAGGSGGYTLNTSATAGGNGGDGFLEFIEFISA